MIVGLLYKSSFNVPQGEKKLIALESFVISVHSSFAHSWLVFHQGKQVIQPGFVSSQVLQNSFFNLQWRELSGGRVGDNIDRQSESKGNPHPDTVAVP